MATTKVKKERQAKPKPKKNSVTLLFDDRDLNLVDQLLDQFDQAGYRYMTRSSILRAALRTFSVQHFLDNAKPSDFL